jgi:hypothetical protein
MTFAAMGLEEERIAIEVFLLSLSASVLFCSVLFCSVLSSPAAAAAAVFVVFVSGFSGI